MESCRSPRKRHKPNQANMMLRVLENWLNLTVEMDKVYGDNIDENVSTKWTDMGDALEEMADFLAHQGATQ